MSAPLMCIPGTDLAHHCSIPTRTMFPRCTMTTGTYSSTYPGTEVTLPVRHYRQICPAWLLVTLHTCHTLPALQTSYTVTHQTALPLSSTKRTTSGSHRGIQCTSMGLRWGQPPPRALGTSYYFTLRLMLFSGISAANYLSPWKTSCGHPRSKAKVVRDHH